MYLPTDFIVLDMDEDLQTPFILGKPFMATARTLIDVEVGTLTFRVHNQSVVFRLFEAAKHPEEQQECMRAECVRRCYSCRNYDQIDNKSIIECFT